MKTRLYAGEEDLERILALQAAVRPPQQRSDFPGRVDFEEFLAQDGAANWIQLWEDDRGGLQGYAWVDGYRNLHFEYRPQPGLGDAMVHWGLARAADLPVEEGDENLLDSNCRGSAAERIALLRRHGFEDSLVRTVHYVHRLNTPPPTPQLPAGFLLRPLAGESEVEGVVALHRAAFGTEQMTEEDRLATLHTSEYSPELDWVVQAADGRLAAYCTGTLSPVGEELVGYTDPVAVHPDFQRLGLAKAMLCAGAAALQARGAVCVRLGTTSENKGMRRAAEAAGFELDYEVLWFSHPFPAEAGAV